MRITAKSATKRYVLIIKLSSNMSTCFTCTTLPTVKENCPILCNLLCLNGKAASYYGIIKIFCIYENRPLIHNIYRKCCRRFERLAKVYI
jgi:hypothetical protein